MLFIVNPAANRTKLAKNWEKFELKLDRLDTDYEVIKTEYFGHSKEIAFQATKNTKHDIIVAVGGDGTAHNIANGIIEAQPDAQTQPKFGILPVGTSNDYCLSLNIPLNLEEAIDVIKKENSDLANTIVCQGDNNPPQHNINLGQVGIVSAISYGVTVLQEKPIFPFNIPPFSFLATGVRRNTLIALKYILWKYSNIPGKITFDNNQDARDINLTFFSFGVGNTMSHYYFCPQADLFGDEFAICLGDNMPKMQRLKLISALKKKDYRNVELLEAKKTILEIDSAISGDADGEVFAEDSKQFTFELKKKQLKVILP